MTSDESQSKMQLAVGPTIFGAYQILLGGPKTAGKLLLPVVVALLAFAGLFAVLGERPTMLLNPSAGEFSLVSIASSFVLIVLYVPAITGWHRYGIFGSHHPAQIAAYRIGRAELAYGVRAAVIIFCVFLFLLPAQIMIGMIFFDTMSSDPATVPTGVLSLLEFALWLVVSYVMCRFSLALPAASIGHSMGIRAAFSRSAGNGGRIFLAMVIAMFPFYLADRLFALITLDPASITGLLVALAQFASDTVGVLIGASVLSLAFRDLVLSQEAGQEVPNDDR